MEVKDILSEKIGDKEIVIVCAGNQGQDVAETLLSLKKNVVCYIDNDDAKHGKILKGIKVYAVEEVINHCPDAVYLITSIDHSEQLYRQLADMGVPDKFIVIIDTYSLIEIKEKCPALWKMEDNYFIYSHPIRNGKIYLKKWFCFYLYQLNRLRKRNIKSEHITKYMVSICAIFKNEALYLKEWLDYHLLVGIEHFYLYNNNSTDDFMKILQPYISKNIVTYIEWPYQQGQISAYLDCVNRMGKESRWLGFIDLDEFITPIKYENVYDFLRKYERYGSVWIPWKVFGSSGIIDRDIEQLVTLDFTSCWNKPSATGKCFYNTRFKLCMDKQKEDMMNHILYTTDNNHIYPPVNVFGQFCVPPIFGGKNKELPIQINHYVIKSRKEYQKKIDGTDAFFKVNAHTNKAFDFHDKKCLSDDYNIQRFVNK